VKKTSAKKPAKNRKAGEDDFTPELGTKICDLIADGETLTKICRAKGMPGRRSVQRWILKYPDFERTYWQARKLSATTLFDKARDEADNTTKDFFMDAKGVKRVDTGIVSRAALRVRTLQWAATKLNPERYGDKVQHTGANDGPIEIAHIERLTPAEVAAELSKLMGVAEKEMGLTPGGSQPVQVRIERIKEVGGGVLPPAIYAALYQHERGPSESVH
jgi:hypothetical protein